jgi:hypothetical protein
LLIGKWRGIHQEPAANGGTAKVSEEIEYGKDGQWSCVSLVTWPGGSGREDMQGDWQLQNGTLIIHVTGWSPMPPQNTSFANRIRFIDRNSYQNELSRTYICLR